jgi:hypothetical protein
VNMFLVDSHHQEVEECFMVVRRLLCRNVVAVNYVACMWLNDQYVF